MSKKRHGFSGPSHLLEESPLTAMDCSSVPAVISHSWEWLRELWPQQRHRGRSRGAVTGGCPSVLPPPPAAGAPATTGQKVVDANGSQGGEPLSSSVRAANEAGCSPCLETSIFAGPGEVLPTLDPLTLENRKLESQELRSN